MMELWHVGLIVKNLDEAIEQYKDILGVGPFIKKDVVTRNGEFRGKSCDLTIKLAQASMGTAEIELIQADPGDNPFWEFLNTQGEGLHHLAYRVQDIEAELARFKTQGIGVLLRGETSTEKVFAYLDSVPQLGTVIQLAQQIG